MNVREAESATEVALVVASLNVRVQQYWFAPEHAPVTVMVFFEVGCCSKIEQLYSAERRVRVRVRTAKSSVDVDLTDEGKCVRARG